MCLIRLTRATSLALAIAFVVPAARAQTPQDRAIAERLFLDGKILMGEKEYERACPKFEQSYGLDPTAMGTLLNLALCHEAMGRPASAWSEFRTVAAESRGKREDRVKLAEEHAALLAPTLSWLTIKVPDGVNVRGLLVKLDGRNVPAAAWGTEMPVNPGRRVVEAEAPGKVGWRAEVTVGKSADKQAVAVEPLRDVPSEPPRPPEPRVDAAATAEALATFRTRRAMGLTFTGLGVAGVAVGVVFGVLAIRRNQDATRLCPSDRCANPPDVGTATTDIAAAKTDAAISNVATGLGIAALSGGVLLILLSRAPAESRVRPAAGPVPLGVGAEASF